MDTVGMVTLKVWTDGPGEDLGDADQHSEFVHGSKNREGTTAGSGDSKFILPLQ